MAFMNKTIKAELAPAIKAVLKKYKIKGTISVRNYSSLVVSLKEGPIDFGPDPSVNVYWIDDHYTGVAKNFLNELLSAMKGPKYFNNDDTMTDYFVRSHYTDINIGKWNKSYKLVKDGIKLYP